ncbi:hypothetical protein [Isoptericola sp. b408]|uniref:hypothetical protein n=1 Tax=Isoptericola sp. b408 TaxID=3064653 RepID=UPI002712922B|nr:hypothetical protein [Isoptericola sp. b408]MDO8150936.1 hypothetical protein [Isoptericola sp. b408]
MNREVPVAVVVLALGVAAAAVPALLVSAVLWFRRRPTDVGEPTLAARRHEVLVSTAALLAAAVCAGALLAQPVTWQPGTPAPGLLQALTPCAVAATFAAVRGVGELTWPRPRGEVRSAPLRRRTARTLGGARLRLMVMTAGCLAATLVGFGLTADPTGRAFPTGPVALADGGTLSGATGPYPGWPYGGPLLVAVLITLGVTGLALATIVRRPPLHGVPGHHDDAVRATSTARLLGAVQLCLGVTLGGVLAVGGMALRNAGSSLLLNGASPHGLVAVGTALALAGGAILLASVVAGLVTVAPRQAPDPATPADAAVA